MRQGDKKLFKDKVKLYQLINLRLNGMALSSLALMFSCDRDSVTKQIVKYGVIPSHIYGLENLDIPEIFTIERIITQVIPVNFANYKVVNGERINLGKSYKEYVAESKRLQLTHSL